MVEEQVVEQKIDKVEDDHIDVHHFGHHFGPNLFQIFLTALFQAQMYTILDYKTVFTDMSLISI